MGQAERQYAQSKQNKTGEDHKTSALENIYWEERY